MRRAPLCITAALVCFGAGCATSPANSSSAAFARRANSVCADFNSRVESLPPPRGAAQLRSFLVRLQALRDSELSGLRAVASTPGRPSRYRAFLSDLAAQNRFDRRLLGDVESGQGALSRAAREGGERLSAKLAKDEAMLELRVCAENPSESTHKSSGSGSGRSSNIRPCPFRTTRRCPIVPLEAINPSLTKANPSRGGDAKPEVSRTR